MIYSGMVGHSVHFHLRLLFLKPAVWLPTFTRTKTPANISTQLPVWNHKPSKVRSLWIGPEESGWISEVNLTEENYTPAPVYFIDEQKSNNNRQKDKLYNSSQNFCWRDWFFENIKSRPSSTLFCSQINDTNTKYIHVSETLDFTLLVTLTLEPQKASHWVLVHIEYFEF